MCVLQVTRWQMTEARTGLASTSVLELPGNEARQQVSSRHNVTVQFAGEEWVVLADGCGSMLVVRTGDRGQHQSSWQVRHVLTF